MSELELAASDFLLILLGLVRIELVFFIAAPTVLSFRFLTKTLLVAHS